RGSPIKLCERWRNPAKPHDATLTQPTRTARDRGLHRSCRVRRFGRARARLSEPHRHHRCGFRARRPGQPPRPGDRQQARAALWAIVRDREPAGCEFDHRLVFVAHAAPDGYTLMTAASTTMATNVSLHKNLPYDPLADFIPIVQIARSPEVLLVN